METFVKKFAAQFEETDATLIKPETEFKKLDEWSSLMALTIIAMANEEYDVKLKGDDIRTARTVEDLFKTVSSNNKFQ